MIHYKETEKYQAKSISVKLNDDGDTGVLTVLTSDAKNVFVFASRHVLARLQRRLIDALDE
jgi:hypothetical protein